MRRAYGYNAETGNTVYALPEDSPACSDYGQSPEIILLQVNSESEMVHFCHAKLSHTGDETLPRGVQLTLPDGCNIVFTDKDVEKFARYSLKADGNTKVFAEAWKQFKESWLKS